MSFCMACFALNLKHVPQVLVPNTGGWPALMAFTGSLKLTLMTTTSFNVQHYPYDRNVPCLLGLPCGDRVSHTQPYIAVRGHSLLRGPITIN